MPSSESGSSWLRQPEYTGENRCWPCTVVNTLIAAVLGVVASVVWPPAGAAVFVVGLALIYLRGYLVPGTPTLTQRYLPDSVLALFGKAPGPGEVEGLSLPEDDVADAPDRASGDAADPPAEETLDPESALLDAGAVEPCADSEDLCLTDSFAEALVDAARDLRDDRDEQRVRLADVLDLTDLDLRQERDRPVAYGPSGRVAAWVSDAALVADLAADAAFRGVHPAWTTLPPEQRFTLLQGVRSFLETCPLCEGVVSLTEDRVKSCCRSWDVIAVRCEECGGRLLELDADRVAAADGQ